MSLRRCEVPLEPIFELSILTARYHSKPGESNCKREGNQSNQKKSTYKFGSPDRKM